VGGGRAPGATGGGGAGAHTALRVRGRPPPPPPGLTLNPIYTNICKQICIHTYIYICIYVSG